ncbi:MAG: hypothetical protein HS126_21535 [Anaerolineales bacterium]|nr:hypothetical protein [Anaerolineales bacterium]
MPTTAAGSSPPTGGPYPHRDDGVEVRRILHKTRSLAIENFNEQFKSILKPTNPCRPKAGGDPPFCFGCYFLVSTRFVVPFPTGLELRVGLKAFIGLPNIYDQPSAN